MNIEQLIGNIRILLSESGPRQVPTALMLAHLEEMEEQSAQVGLIPPNYPAHVNIVMRMIHALLPWYTRPIREFCRAGAATAREQCKEICDLVRQNEEILVRLDALERELQSRRGSTPQ